MTDPLGFHISAPLPLDSRIMHHLDKLKATRKLTLHSLARDPRVEFCVEHTDDRLSYGLFARGLCIGHVSFARVATSTVDCGLPDVFRPKSRIHSGWAGRGIMREFYLTALRHGYSLMVDKHTESAAGLWSAVARELGVPIRYWDRETHTWVGIASPTTLKILTLRTVEKS